MYIKILLAILTCTFIVIILLATAGYGDLLRAAYIGTSSTTDQIALNNTTSGDIAGIGTTASSPESPCPVPSVTIVSPSVSVGSGTPIPNLAAVQPESTLVTPTATHQTPPTPPTVPPMIANDGKHKVLPTPPPVPTIFL